VLSRDGHGHCAALARPFRSRWDRESESPLLQRGVCEPSVPQSPQNANRIRVSGRRLANATPAESTTGPMVRIRLPPPASQERTVRLPAISARRCAVLRLTGNFTGVRLSPLHAHRPVGIVAGLIDLGSLRRLSGGRHEDPASLPICVASCVVVLPFEMRFYLGGFGVKRQVQEALLACALGACPLE
jgi:hypothetical protein